jgi:hypothetical protein
VDFSNTKGFIDLFGKRNTFDQYGFKDTETIYARKMDIHKQQFTFQPDPAPIQISQPVVN